MRDPWMTEPAPKEFTGGIIKDFIAHGLDLAMHLAGSRFCEVSVTGTNLIFDPSKDFDTVVGTGRLENGALVAFDCSKSASYGYDQRMEVFGSLGKTNNEPKRIDEAVLADKDGYRTSVLKEDYQKLFEDAFRDNFRHFVKVLREGAAVSASREDARNVLLVSTAAEESTRQRKTINITY